MTITFLLSHFFCVAGIGSIVPSEFQRSCSFVHSISSFLWHRFVWNSRSLIPRSTENQYHYISSSDPWGIVRFTAVVNYPRVIIKKVMNYKILQRFSNFWTTIFSNCKQHFTLSISISSSFQHLIFNRGNDFSCNYCNNRIFCFSFEFFKYWVQYFFFTSISSCQNHCCYSSKRSHIKFFLGDIIAL